MIDFETNFEPPVWALVLLIGVVAFAAVCTLVVIAAAIGYVYSKGWI